MASAAIAMAAVTSPEDVFRTMCERHDLTYSFSDDSSVYRRGEAQYKEIESFAQAHLPYPVARNIWNDTVRQKTLSPEMFLWPEDKKDLSFFGGPHGSS